MEPILRSITSFIAAFYMGRSLFQMFFTKPKRWKRMGIYLLLAVAISLPSWVGDENPILILPFFMLGFICLLSGDLLPRWIMGCIFYALIIPINMLIDSQYWGNTLEMILLCCKALMWCVLSCILFHMIPEGGLQLSRKLWMLVGGLTLAPFVSMLSFSIWGNTFQREEDYRFYSFILRRFGVTILPFVWLSVLAILIAIIVLSRHEALVQENKLAAMREVYYAGVKQEQMGLRTLRHDLRNHVTAIRGMLEQGKQREADQYLQELSDSSALCGGGRYSGNDIVNVVLASKVAQMEALGLVAKFEVALPETLAFPASELCALLGNALDNAIEGSVDADNKTITLRVRLEKGMFMLQVQNAVGHAIHEDLSTTKQNPLQHGLGLAGMREIATRHGGSLKTTVEDSHFELLVCFPCKESRC